MQDPASFGGYDPPSNQTWFVYLLNCADGTYYVGCTSNLNERLNRHTKGWVSATKGRIPVELTLYICFFERHHAFSFEKYLKSGSGRAFTKRHLVRSP
ncbi:MAG: GIY-YIG nuclease family protein [Saprospiraceae bacterium]